MMQQTKKQMADRAGSHRHSHQHWQRIRMECTDEAYYAGYGFFAEGGYLDFSLAICSWELQQAFWERMLKNTDRAAAV